MSNQNDDGIDWDNVDSDWIAENRPDRLSAIHRERLIMRHGERAGDEKYQNAVLRMLRGVRIIPPSRERGSR